MFYYIYVLESEEGGDLYIGYTSDLIKRLREHNLGEVKSTKHKTPWKCIYFEGCLNEKDAKRRERYMKHSQGRRMLKRRLREYFYSK